MPKIEVKITEGEKEVSEQFIEVKSDNFPDLLAALKVAKNEANAVLTTLVDASKDPKQARSLEDDDKSDTSSSVEDDDNTRKRQKS